MTENSSVVDETKPTGFQPAGFVPEGETMAATDAETNLDDVPESDRPYLPGQEYTLVCIGASFGKSKASGNNMLTFEWEVVEPKIVVFKGNETAIEGVKIQEYASLQVQALGKLKTLHKKLGLPMSININSPDTRVYTGKALVAFVSTKQQAMVREGTNEVVIDPETKKPIANNQYRVERYLAGAPEKNRVIPF